MVKSEKQFLSLEKLHKSNIGRRHKPETIKLFKKIRNTREWKEKVCTKERNEKIRKKVMGNRRGVGNLLRGWKGRKHSEETKEKMREQMRERWKNKEYREKTIKNLLKRLRDRPTSLERKAIEIIKQNNLPYKYVGDGSFLIGYKNPDFINMENKKICLEVCNYFHHQGNYKKDRIKYFVKWGWKCLVFYEDELDKLKNLAQSRIKAQAQPLNFK